ncbi:DUF4153 domain-containing protein [Krasilnikovia sp. MM14-A1004]|uniref:DUF4153 domain-containing protein n=1 Tax=Krasilnikovia sp. MM14-A1004 TaxID=3373541 RepID=UPI00399CFA0B
MSETPKPPAPATPVPATGAPATPAAVAPRQTPAGQTPAGQTPAGRATPNWGPPAMNPLHGPWIPVSLWGRRWAGPGRPASPATLLAIVVAAVVAALSLPLDRPGLGWMVTAVAGVAALVVARFAPYPSGVPVPLVSWRAPALPPARFAWSAATVLLLSAGTLRAAGWLFALCVLTAAVTSALAVAGGRSMRGMVVATMLAPFSVLRALPWLIRGLARIRRGGPSGSGVRVAATVAVSVALLVVFGALFASADAAFSRMLDSIVPDMRVDTVVRWCFIFAVTAGLLSGAAYLRAAPPDLSGWDRPGTRTVRRLEWAVPLCLLVAMFAVFVGVQLTVLFGGAAHVLETEGLTYAEYARSGFWQLLVVTGLTLLVLAGAARWAPRDSRTDRVLIRVVLGALAGLTLVIVASALHRMDLYADTYGLTRLRVLVALCEVWLGVVFVLVLVAGVRLRAAWLPRVAVGAGVFALLALVAANPDGLIADRNVDRFARTHKIDTWYLSTLSPDAVPALDRLPQPERDCALGPIALGLHADPDDWRGTNYGRSRARDLLAARPVASDRRCPTWYGSD